MKIKLSKTQWSYIGKTDGWLDNNEDLTSEETATFEQQEIDGAMFGKPDSFFDVKLRANAVYKTFKDSKEIVRVIPISFTANEISKKNEHEDRTDSQILKEEPSLYYALLKYAKENIEFPPEDLPEKSFI
jgi:hypothetical protein